uniref:Uncharacterized protein n=1 Tax=Mycena chlorophos TaxID=658473 RepID=A0ABQ0L3K7_MYCCL|nr:predicted protein [Mycena chlorophos]
MKTDPHADVRSLIVDKMATKLIDDVNKGDIKPALFARMRDNEAAVRRTVYRQVFDHEKGARDGNLFTVCPSSGFQRLLEKADCALIQVVGRNRLGDREAVVREAAASIIKFDDFPLPVRPATGNGCQWREATGENLNRVRRLACAEPAQQQEGYCARRPLRRSVSDFSSRFKKLRELDDFLAKRTPETVFPIRAFAEDCSNGREQLLEDCGMPVATLCAFQTQSSINELLGGDRDKLAVLPPDNL